TFLPLVTNPVYLELARHALGDGFRVGDVGVIWIQPGAPGQNLHCDVPLGKLPEPLPDAHFLLNSMFMLSDFTRDNGATLVLPFSHRSHRRPRAGIQYKHLVAAEGRRGSVLVFHGALWHGSGPNVSTEQHRLSATVPLFASWMDASAGNWTTMPRSAFNR